jgi:NTP pyrophosphatase (non-canonical NTP hydrolase)
MGIAYWGYRKYSALKLESKGESIGEVFAFLVIKSKVLGESITSAHKSEVEQQVEDFKKRMIGLARAFLTYCQIITVR